MKKTVKISILIISILWVLHTLSKNFMIDPTFEKFISRKDQILPDPSMWTLMIRFHILLALIALLTGPLGVIKRIRVKSIHFHRWNGRLYALSILLNFIPGIYVSLFATGGWSSTVGFLILNILWLGTTFMGYFFIKRKNMILHSQWMIRSLFLTFSNMTIYIIVTISHNIIHLSYGHSYTIAVWLCWTLNLFLAEIIIRRKVL